MCVSVQGQSPIVFFVDPWNQLLINGGPEHCNARCLAKQRIKLHIDAISFGNAPVEQVEDSV
jgi:hypothetical protein